MENQIAKRIEELVAEIEGLLSAREQHHRRIDLINDDITAKQGAIFELKKLLDSQGQSTVPEDSSG